MITAADLESLLTAHEHHGHGAFAPTALAALDEREEFQAAAVHALDEAGLPAHYLVARYVRLLTRAVCVQVWRAAPGDFPADPVWLRAALHRSAPAPVARRRCRDRWRPRSSRNCWNATAPAAPSD
ncbi:hypothetical protein ACIOEX_28150 [Streptomyces sp. NPDC087850]|uniref:hypothetical protein n=1 Tax=unclassified Streptomyces TaxID=2593676 RepID=UPI00381D0A88